MVWKNKGEYGGKVNLFRVRRRRLQRKTFSTENGRRVQQLALLSKLPFDADIGTVHEERVGCDMLSAICQETKIELVSSASDIADPH